MRTGTGIASAILAASLVTLVAGCGGGGGGSALFSTAKTTGAATTATAASSPPTSGAPEVTHPLNTTKYQQDPCSILSATQLQGLGVDITGEPKTYGTAVTCTWTDPAETQRTQVSIDVSDQTGLGGVYTRKNEWPSFQPMRIGGYPTVLAESTGGQSPNTSCEAFIGVADNLAVSFFVALGPENPGHSVPCSVAQQWAADAVTTMTSGG